jgi:hypothetical protein
VTGPGPSAAATASWDDPEPAALLTQICSVPLSTATIGTFVELVRAPAPEARTATKLDRVTRKLSDRLMSRNVNRRRR